MADLQEEELLIDDTEPTDDDESQNIRYEIASFPTDFTVKVMYEKWQSGQLVIPDYQRRYVWNLPQASRLIESFLLGLPIPQIFLYRQHSGPELYVVDGHQRLATIAHFYSEQFSHSRIFRLQGVNPNWSGKTYTELNEDDRLTLDDATLRSIVIRQIQPNDNSSVYQIFERLNTGGTQLSPMEIRRAIFRGNANELLERINSNHNWRAILGRAEPDPRFRDVELVLRVLSLADNWRSYSKPMKNFITAHMAVLDKTDSKQLSLIEKRFYKICKRVRTALGDKPFHLRHRLNLAALDVVMASSFELLDSMDSDLAYIYEQLQENDRFMETVTHNTSDVAAVQERFKLTQQALMS